MKSSPRLGRVVRLEDRVTPDVGDTLALAQATGLTGVGSFAFVEPLGDGAAGSKDVDLYALTATAGQRLTVLTTPKAVGGVAADTIVRVFDATGSQLTLNDDYAGKYSRLTTTLPVAGTYFVGVSGFNNAAYNPGTGAGTVAGGVGDYTLSLGVAAAVPWTPQGSSILNGQVEGMAAQSNPVSGAAQALVPHPTNADILYAATTNGGVWRTANATAASPNWTPLTDRLGSLSVGALEADPTDPTFNTLVAGTGRVSSFGRDGGPMLGLLRTTDGGATWATLASGLPTAEYVRGIAARGATIVAGFRATTSGIYRSTNTGASFTKISGAAGTGLPAGGVFDLAADPGDANRLYALTTAGVFRSNDLGSTWVNVTPAGISLASAGNARIAVHNNVAGGTNAVYFGFTIGGFIRTVFRSADAGASWVSMGVPGSDIAAGAITGASNASPIVITDNSHGLTTGTLVSVSGAQGNTAANGVRAVTVLTANTFSLNGSAGNGAYTGGGYWSRAFPITEATWPGLITITSAAHGLATADMVTIEGAQGNTAANGTWVVTVLDANRFSLDYSVGGSGAYTGGGTWRRSEGLQPIEPEVHPDKVEDYAGGQGDIHFSIAADPVSPTVVYFGGDRQPSPFPNSIGAQNFSGRLYRGDAALPAGGQWAPLTHVGTSNNSSPHADSRDIEFDAAGNIVEGDDGGVYRRTSPRTAAGKWEAMVGNMTNTESHSAAYDSLNGVFTIGTQDVGSARQVTAGSPWQQVNQGDGGQTQISVSGSQSTRYSSSQFLGSFRRQVYNNAGGLVSTTGLATVADAQFYTPFVLHATTPTRLALGGSNNLYESANQGTSWTTSVASTGTIGSLALGHAGNADAFFASSSAAANRFLVRETAGGGVVNRTSLLPFTGNVARFGIAMDPDDWRTVYVATTAGRVWRSTDAGATAGGWADITGDLLGRLGTARGGVSLVDGAAADTLLVAGNAGVFAMSTATPGAWYELGAESLPNAAAYDLKAYPGGDLVSLGTLGRGVWSVGTAAGRFDATAPTVTGVTRAAASPAVTPGVAFTVSFPEPVAGLTAANFTAVVGAGLTGAGAILSVAPSATGAAWTVVVAAGVGAGTLGLNWATNGAVLDLAGNPLTGGTVTGELFAIDRPRPTLTLAQVNGSAGVQRSRVTSLVVTFSAPVLVAADAFTLTRTGGGTLTSAGGGIAFTPPGAGGAASITLTFSGPPTEFGSLIDGRWSLAVNPASVTNAASGVSLAAAGATAFHRLYGDGNGDAFVDGTDETAFGSTFGLAAADPAFAAPLDWNGDGFIDGTDETAFGSRFGTSV